VRLPSIVCSQIVGDSCSGFASSLVDGLWKVEVLGGDHAMGVDLGVIM